MSTSVAAGTYTSGDYNGRYYGKYLPSSYDGSEAVPLVMMLHGCSQNTDGFKDETQMNQVAEENGFIAVYPEETEGIYSCWNRFEDSNTLRGQGQVKELAEGIVGQVASNENIDEDRVYVAGFSAGAYMVPNLLVEYADVFAAGAIHSGGMYDVAESQSEGNNVISDSDYNTGSSADPQEEGRHAYDRMEQHGIDEYQVPTMVFHSTDDNTVYPCHGEDASEQATQTNDLLNDSDNESVDYSADQTNTGSGPDLTYTEYVYEDSDGNPIVDHYVVDGMGHAWSGGSDTGSYTAPGGPEASQIIWDYFKQWDNSPNDSPNADIQSSADAVSTGETVDFDGTGSTDVDGSISSYDWDFGNGNTASGSTVSHSFSSTGTYTVTLTVTDDNDETATATVTISVTDPNNSGPTANASASSTDVTTDDTVTFDGSGSSDSDGSITAYEWDLGDGTTATGSTVDHSYDSAGDYTVTLTVTDDDGAQATNSITVSVESGLYCGTDTNSNHVSAGRAYSSGGCYYAEGSNQYLGCMGSSEITLKETSTGYYEEVSSCDGSDDDDDGSWWSW